VLYRVIYSELVRQATRDLIQRAADVGRAVDVLNAVKQIDYVLALYPQFGQPLRDLLLKPAQMWIGVVPPLVVHYVLDEDAKRVFVPLPFVPFTRSGF
jgi:hypothetical protein